MFAGGGSVGCQTLYHLAKRGVTNAVLLEKDSLTAGTTWHTAGLVWRLRPSDVEIQLLSVKLRPLNITILVGCRRILFTVRLFNGVKQPPMVKKYILLKFQFLSVSFPAVNNFWFTTYLESN
jgi:hypothetical protein